MKTMTARDAKTHFAVDTLIPEMFMDKESGYDEWFAARVTERLAAWDTGAASHEHDEVMARVQALTFPVLRHGPGVADRSHLLVCHRSPAFIDFYLDLDKLSKSR